MITLYSTNCPKCRQLEKRLNEREIQYTICSDIEIMKSLGISTVPYLKVDDKLLNFAEAWRWASEVNK